MGRGHLRKLYFLGICLCLEAYAEAVCKVSMVIPLSFVMVLRSAYQVLMPLSIRSLSFGNQEEHWNN